MYKYKYLLNVTQDVEHSLQTLFQVPFSNLRGGNGCALRFYSLSTPPGNGYTLVRINSRLSQR